MQDLKLGDGKRGFTREGNLAIFYQLGVKVDLAVVEPEEYFDWLDDAIERLPSLVPGARIIEKPDSRVSPVVNTGVYYDTADRRLLHTGSLLRTTSAVTHAFCAFKRADDGSHVRKDHRYVSPTQTSRCCRPTPPSRRRPKS